MQTKNATIGQRAYGLINTTGRTGFDASPSQWMTVEIIGVGVGRSVGPVHVSVPEGATLAEFDQAAREHVRRSSGRSFLVRAVAPDKAKGEPGYFRVREDTLPRYFVVGPHQLQDWAGYDRATAAKRAKAEAKAEAMQARAEANAQKALEARQARIEALIQAEGIEGDTADLFRRLAISGLDYEA